MSNTEFLQRSVPLLGAEAIDKLANATVALAGVGGVGGAIAPVLARLGVGAFKLADPGEFDLPDLNRQYAADHTTLGENKARVYADVISSINPDVAISVYETGVDASNVKEFIEGSDIVVDALDVDVAPALRMQFHQEAIVLQKPVLFPPIIGFGTLVAMSVPGGMTMEPIMKLLGEASQHGQLPPGLAQFMSPEALKVMGSNMAQGVVPSIAISPNLAGAAVAMEAMLYLCGDALPFYREPTCLPHVTIIDLFSINAQVVHLEELLKGA
jgi:hypothetical protein